MLNSGALSSVGVANCNSNARHTVTANADVQHSTSYSKFGSSSMYFDGTGDYLSIPQTADFDFGTGDYTLEFWIRHGGVSESILHINAVDGDGLYFAYQAGTHYRFSPGSGAADWVFSLTHTVAIDSNFHHIAVVCSSGTTTMYFDGVDVANTTTVADIQGNTGTSVIGGRYGGQYAFGGYLDELRISNTARYTSGFTPSTTAFDCDDNTLLLVHSDTTNGSTTFVGNGHI
jgi:hypothetical protein